MVYPEGKQHCSTVHVIRLYIWNKHTRAHTQTITLPYINIEGPLLLYCSHCYCCLSSERWHWLWPLCLRTEDSEGHPLMRDSPHHNILTRSSRETTYTFSLKLCSGHIIDGINEMDCMLGMPIWNNTLYCSSHPYYQLMQSGILQCTYICMYQLFMWNTYIRAYTQCTIHRHFIIEAKLSSMPKHPVSAENVSCGRKNGSHSLLEGYEMAKQPELQYFSRWGRSAQGIFHWVGPLQPWLHEL